MSGEPGVAERYQIFFQNWFFQRTRVALILLVPLTFPLAIASRAPMFGPNFIFQLLLVSYPLMLAAVFYAHLLHFSLARKRRLARTILLGVSLILLAIVVRNIYFLFWSQYIHGDLNRKNSAGIFPLPADPFVYFSLIVVGVHLPLAALMEVLSRYSRKNYGWFTVLVLIFLYLSQGVILALICAFAHQFDAPLTD